MAARTTWIVRAILTSCLGLGVAGLLSARAAFTAPSRIVVGNLGCTWVCGDGAPEVPEYDVIGPGGHRWKLTFSSGVGLTYGQLQELVGRRIEVRSAAQRGLDERRDRELVVDALAPLDGELPTVGSPQINDGQKGPKPFATLLCRFADSTNVTPRPVSFFQGLFSTTTPALDSYFQSVSGGQINLGGSRSSVFGWFNLPRIQSAYLKADGSFDKELALSDAVAVADSQVDFRDFYGINLAFNIRPFPNDLVGFGGRRLLTLDGEQKVWGITWIGQHEQCIWAHEMGHSFGLPHSSGPYNVPYDSKWDLMSQPFLGNSANLGRVAEGSIGYHYLLLGWVSETRLLTVNPNEQADRVVETISQVKTGTGIQVIRLPISADGKRYYTVEARRKVGYDATIPGEGVLIHAIDLLRADRVAQVVDATNDGNPNDAGAIWTPGETFTDSVNKVQLTVAASAGTGFRVQVSSGLLPPTELKAKVTAAREVALTWRDNSTNETAFVVQRRKENVPFADLAPLPANTTSYTDKSVEARTTYSYRVMVQGSMPSKVFSLEIPVSTGVGVTGKLSVAGSLQFGKVKVGKSKAKPLLIRNLSANSPMEVTVQEVPTPFRVTSPVSFTLAARGQSNLSVTFRPTAKKAFRGVLLLRTSDPTASLARVNLVGTGKK